MTRRKNRKERELSVAAKARTGPSPVRPATGQASLDKETAVEAPLEETVSREIPKPPESHANRRPRPFSIVSWVAVAAVAAVAALAYANSISPATVHDDAFFVPARHDLSAASIAQIFQEDTWASTGSPAGTYRPLTILSIAVNGGMFGRTANGYHATNVALHAAASVFVFLLVLELLVGATPPMRRSAAIPKMRSAAIPKMRSAAMPRMRPAAIPWSDTPVWAAALAAAVFAVHPVHTEAVDSVFNRSEVLATIGVVASLWIIRRWHETRPVATWIAAAVLYLFGLLCRESAVTLPALAALMLWFVHRDEPLAVRMRRIAPVAVLVIPLAEYAVLRQHALATAVQAVTPVLGVETEQDFVSRVSYSAAALREYARMMVWPWPLRMSYENFAGEGVLLTCLVHAILVAAAFVTRRTAPLVTFAIGFFYVALLPSTRIFTALGASLQVGGEVLMRLQNSLLVAERVAYLPSVSFAIVLAVAFVWLSKRSGIVPMAALAAVPIAAGWYVTMERNREWQRADTLFAAEVQADPDNTDAWRLYVSALSNSERYEEAATACDSQLERPGRSAQLFNNCGVAYDKLGRDEQSIRAYTYAIEQGLVTVGHANRGRAYARMGRMAEAESEYIAAAESENDPARRHYRNGLAIARFHPERAADARREFEAALALQPDYAAARDALQRLPR